MSVLEGKAMVVAMSRDIGVSLFDEIIKLRSEWAGTKLTKDGKDIGWNHEDGAIRIDCRHGVDRQACRIVC